MHQFILSMLYVAASSVYERGLKKISKRELDGQFDLELGIDAIEALNPSYVESVFRLKDSCWQTRN